MRIRAHVIFLKIYNKGWSKSNYDGSIDNLEAGLYFGEELTKINIS